LHCFVVGAVFSLREEHWFLEAFEHDFGVVAMILKSYYRGNGQNGL
jgi:hypothetical protein